MKCTSHLSKQLCFPGSRHSYVRRRSDRRGWSTFIELPPRTYRHLQFKLGARWRWQDSWWTRATGKTCFLERHYRSEWIWGNRVCLCHPLDLNQDTLKSVKNKSCVLFFVHLTWKSAFSVSRVLSAFHILCSNGMHNAGRIPVLVFPSIGRKFALTF